MCGSCGTSPLKPLVGIDLRTRPSQCKVRCHACGRAMEGGCGGGEEGQTAAPESKRREGRTGPSNAHRLEDQINLQHLEELMEVFHVRHLHCYALHPRVDIVVASKYTHIRVHTHSHIYARITTCSHMQLAPLHSHTYTATHSHRNMHIQPHLHSQVPSATCTDTCIHAYPHLL